MGIKLCLHFRIKLCLHFCHSIRRWV